ncbi:hypothetical protein F9802_07455 [Bacillus aerolatus]|uniref:LXG domain-containing protein n=1 Tax=Bacillus aerolatus TaxID=2653354 RepID=A0A6I1FX56_9BACI|nr:T7SS effector LXG polymorphic toxin [Bacillus aerolatus]KAB7707573.1 hypothetical protein F9802_07455 [Bacillus aerolatus]
MANSVVYESQTLIAAMEERAGQYTELKTQMNELKKQFTAIVDMENELQGEGAEAIKGFYSAQSDVVDAWIRLIDRHVAFFNGISGAAEEVELSGSTIVQVPFLKDDLFTAHQTSNDMVTAQQDDLQKIFDRINDLVPLEVFSREEFDINMEKANKKRTDTIEKVIALDGELMSEYAMSESEEAYLITLFAQLLASSERGGAVSPIHFDSQAYESSEVYKLKEEAEKQTVDYLTFKEDQAEARKVAKEMEEMKNRPWYEKTWDTISTFTGEVTGYYDYKRASEGIDPVTGEKLSDAQRVTAGAMAAAGFIPVVGWLGRGVKGGSAIYKTAKGLNAADHALDAYKGAGALSTLQKTEMGIYGLVTANGFSEAVTGRDMFGNELTAEQRENSFIQALANLGLGGTALYVDRLQAKNALYSVNKLSGTAVTNKDAFQPQLNDVLKKHGLQAGEFNQIRLKPVSSYSAQEVQVMKDIRRSVQPIKEDTMMQKVLPPSAKGWLFQAPGDGGQIRIGGFIAKAADTESLDTYDKVFEGLRLDYKGTAEWPNEYLTSDSALAIKYKATKPEDYKIPFGGQNEDELAKMVKDDKGTDFLDQVQGDPFTGNGFTKSENYTIPEYENRQKIDLYDGAELYEIDVNGQKLIAVYDELERKFVSVK